MPGWRLERGTGLNERVLPRPGGVRLALGAVLYTVGASSLPVFGPARLVT